MPLEPGFSVKEKTQDSNPGQEGRKEKQGKGDGEGRGRQIDRQKQSHSPRQCNLIIDFKGHAEDCLCSQCPLLFFLGNNDCRAFSSPWLYFFFNFKF